MPSQRLYIGIATGFLTPNQLVAKKAEEKARNEQFHESLLAEKFEYEPKILIKNPPFTNDRKPIPLNVELLQYKPLRLPQTHGHKVAELSFKGYDNDDLLRASEFAARAAFYLGIPVSKIEMKKTKKRLYTIIRSPFAQAKSKENWWRVTYHQGLTAFDANPEVIDLWISYINKNAIDGVKYEAQIPTKEALNFAEQLKNLEAKDIQMLAAYTEGSEDPVSKKVQELLGSEEFKKALEEK
ncbi:ribosomal protein S10 [Metschnikowia bicuspidata]|uniref:Ribosomal protein S10 n=1 Tax=Metschnikowia bicuspidata TaxID=27322 RepID=A0A4P9ZBE2_9ASCO|nr:ribosomal protein S10 [Metschnikowia bicuspidata]